MATNKPGDVQLSTIRSPSPALSPTSTLVDSSPHTPVRHRPTFARLASILDGNSQKYDAVKGSDMVDTSETHTNRDDGSAAGLGISYKAEPTHTRSLSGSTYDPNVNTAYDPVVPGSAYWSSSNNGKRSVNSLQSSLQQSFTPPTETQPLRGQKSFADTLRMTYNEFSPDRTCAASQKFRHGRLTCTSLLILVLALYSTILSCIYLVIAARGPRYGKFIGRHGALSSANANLLTAFFAKTIELSFATVFVAFLGQVLWRRALYKGRGQGVTLAEMDMRSWVMQPGIMLTRFGALRSSAVSLLGVLTLTAAIVSMLYTTASEALVQPQLKYGDKEKLPMQGLVKSSWANTAYLAQQCASPTKSGDTQYGGTTCLQIEYAAQAFHNYQRYLSDWEHVAGNGNGTADLTLRPQGFALMTENTTVSAQWIEIKNMTEDSIASGRIVNNVSMAMPHAGVTNAARDSTNGILQPEDLDGLGVYSLHASVPSPALNVLCANMNQNEVFPLILNATDNRTVVDDLFGWGDEYGQAPPIFPKMPIDFNTVLNQTGLYGRKAIYLLGKAGPENLNTSPYVLCSIKAYQTPNCSTRYNVSSTGAQLEALCEDNTDDMLYVKSLTNATEAPVSTDWVEGATDWANSLSLNAGAFDGNASNARLLTQLIFQASVTPDIAELNEALPSPAEALAVMAGCTLLMGTLDTPFVEFWNYTASIIDPGQYQFFNATLRAQQYASGGSKGYQHGFFAVLAIVFALDLLCLIYLLANKGMITDFSEPVNLFSLAVNSPPSEAMAGSCGSGPQGKQYQVPWYVNAAGEHLYIDNVAIHEGDEHGTNPPTTRHYTDEPLSPIKWAYRRLSKQASHV